VLRPAAAPGPVLSRRAPRAEGIDPRIAARRIAVKRDEGRRRLRRLAWVGGAAALVAGAVLLTRTPLFDVDEVRVAGADHIGADVVREAAAAAGAGRGDLLVDVRLDEVADAIEELPAVAEASVERDWPGTVTIEVVERVPVAVVPAGASLAVVAADGVVVDVATASPGLPALGGVTVDAEPGAVAEAGALLAVAAALPPELLGAVEAINAPDDDELELALADGGRALLGAGEDLDAKLDAVATMLAQADLGCLDTLDVRVPSSPAVTRVAGCGL
jgi:cell division protein FtsQ